MAIFHIGYLSMISTLTAHFGYNMYAISGFKKTFWMKLKCQKEERMSCLGRNSGVVTIALIILQEKC